LGQDAIQDASTGGIVSSKSSVTGRAIRAYGLIFRSSEDAFRRLLQMLRERELTGTGNTAQFPSPLNEDDWETKLEMIMALALVVIACPKAEEEERSSAFFDEAIRDLEVVLSSPPTSGEGMDFSRAEGGRDVLGRGRVEEGGEEEEEEGGDATGRAFADIPALVTEEGAGRGGFDR
jgi:hypothetical protein